MTEQWCLKWSYGPPPEKSLPTSRHQTEENNSVVNKPVFAKKRDQLNEKLGDRELMPCTGTNPFRNKNNYGEDIDIQSRFLIPGSNSCQ